MKTDILMLVGRLLMSIIFILAGFMKVTTAAATQEILGRLGLPLPMIAWLVTVVIEVGGGLALLLGFATRPVAAILGVWCVATALVAHSNFADQAMRLQFMKNLVMAGGFAYVFILGAGAFSIDGWRRHAASRT